MKTFKSIDLNDSYVLSWECSEGRLCFWLEASIWPGSEHYQLPKENEYTCYKHASLCFVNFESIYGLRPMSEVCASIDSAGEVDYGNIDSLVQTMEGFEVSGDFGNVRVKGGQLAFKIET